MQHIVRKPDFHEKKWGEEAWIVNNPKYCGKVLTLYGSWRCSIHHHKIKHETFCVLDGEIYMEVEGETFYMLPGDVIEISPLTKHRFTGVSLFSEFIEFSTQHFEDDSYRDTESGHVPEEEWANIYANSSTFKLSVKECVRQPLFPNRASTP